MKKGRNSGEKEDGNALWQNVTRGVKAYSPPSRALPARPPKAPASVKKPVSPRAPSASTRPPSTPEAKGFDTATETKLRRGKLPLEGRLDLHGMTQAEACDALRHFIHQAVAEGKRTVLVITGKGGVTSGGVLKRMLPLWLEDPDLKRHLIALTPAQPRDGGGGAFYLRLRKVR